MGRLTAPQPIFASLDGSATMNLSSGERPVWRPVRTTSGPSAASRPSPARIASSYSSAVERLARRTLPIEARVPTDCWVGLTIYSRSAAARIDQGRSESAVVDRPRVPWAALRGRPGSRLSQSRESYIVPAQVAIRLRPRAPGCGARRLRRVADVDHRDVALDV